MYGIFLDEILMEVLYTIEEAHFVYAVYKKIYIGHKVGLRRVSKYMLG